MIDSKGKSALAAWMMAKRGIMPVLLLAKGFAEGKAEARKLSDRLPGLNLDVHQASVSGRRELLLAACALAEKNGAGAVVSGDIFKDVSRKGELRALDEGLPLPVFRPLIGMGSRMVEKYLARAGFSA
ncbi:tRNA sulfurtransferase [uncultured archaeon]|nr:tRNA sulfurtransferase [uncultured archaeon]